MIDIVDTLYAGPCDGDDAYSSETMTFAAVEIEKLRARIAELEAALEPFADDAECYDHLTGDELVPVSVRDIRAARAALEKKNEGL